METETPKASAYLDTSPISTCSSVSRPFAESRNSTPEICRSPNKLVRSHNSTTMSKQDKGGDKGGAKKPAKDKKPAANPNNELKTEEVLQAVILADSFDKRFSPITLEKPRYAAGLLLHFTNTYSGLCYQSLISLYYTTPLNALQRLGCRRSLYFAVLMPNSSKSS